MSEMTSGSHSQVDGASRGSRLSRLMSAGERLLYLAAGVLLVFWAVGIGTGRPAHLDATSDAAATSAPIGLTATPEAARYTPGQPITLTVTVTNQSDRPCALAAIADGTVTLGVTRDGHAEFPAMGAVDYLDGFDSYLASNSQTVAPGAGLTFQLQSAVPTNAAPNSTSRSLHTVAVIPHGSGVAADYPVDQTGSYQFTMTYRMPVGVPNACTGTSAPTTFALTIAKKECGTLLWLPGLLAGAGTGRLRRIRRAVVATTSALFLTATTTPAARAEVVYNDPTDVSFVNDVKGCLATYDDPLHDPAQINALIHGKHPIYLSRAQDSEHRSEGTNDWILWNPDDRSAFQGDTTKKVPCASLYHEFVHALDHNNKNTQRVWCDSTGITQYEVRATRAENRYRAGTIGGQRHTYGGHELPSGTDPSIEAVAADCAKLGPPTGGVPPASREALDGAGGSNGDPHLTTFDDRRYDFMAAGEFVLAKADSDLEVQVRQSAFPDSRTVSVNSAVAMRVGSDRLTFAMVDDNVAAAVNGKPVDLSVPGAGPTRLPAGGSVSTDADGDYVVQWPDGTLAQLTPISIWGLRVLIYPATARKGHFQGLLGNYDGDPANDLRTADGTSLPENPSREQLYGAFADSWRVTQASSLLPYPQGTKTETFTDKSFPDKVVKVADLDPSRRDQARDVCTSLGIVDEAALNACVIDVALTGQPAFAIDAAETERHIGNAVRSGPHPPPLRALHDGDVVSGNIEHAGQVDSYPLDVGAATSIVRLAEVSSPNRPDGSLTLQIDTVPAAVPDSPGLRYTSVYQYPIIPGGSYQLQVRRTDGDVGPYSFRVVTQKETRLPLSLDATTSGSIDVPGRVNIYTFKAPANGKLYLKHGTGCDLSAGVTDDTKPPSVIRIEDPCPAGDGSVAVVEQGKDYVLAVWSDELKTGSYSFVASMKPPEQTP